MENELKVVVINMTSGKEVASQPTGLTADSTLTVEVQEAIRRARVAKGLPALQDATDADK